MNEQKRSVVAVVTTKHPVTISGGWDVTSDLCRQIATYVITTSGFSQSDQYAFNFSEGTGTESVTVVSNSGTQQRNSTNVAMDATLVAPTCTVFMEAKAGTIDSAWQRLQDYISGVARSINPLPVETRELFVSSDRAALHSDWVNAQSDIAAVYNAVRLVRNALETHSHGKRESRERPDEAVTREHAEAG